MTPAPRRRVSSPPLPAPNRQLKPLEPAEDPQLASNIQSFCPHHRRAWRAPHTTLLNRATTASSCKRRPPPSRQRMAALALVDGSHTLLPQHLELRVELVRSTTAIVRRRVDRCAACAGESISQTSLGVKDVVRRRQGSVTRVTERCNALLKRARVQFRQCWPSPGGVR